MISYKREAQFFIEQYDKIHMNQLIDQCVISEMKCEDNTYIYFRIIGIGRTNEDISSIDMFTQIYTGLCSARVPFSFIVKGTEKNIEVFIGTKNNLIEILYRLFYSIIPEFITNVELCNEELCFGISDIVDSYTDYGFLKGIPCRREAESMMFLDELVLGMREKEFCYRVDAEPLVISATRAEYHKWSDLLDESMELAKNQISYASGTETITYEKKSNLVTKFSELAEKYCAHYEKMEKLGSWITCIQYATKSGVNADILSGIYAAALSGDDKSLERAHNIKWVSKNPFIEKHIIEKFKKNSDPILPKYCNVLSSEELAIVTAFPKMDCFGFSVRDTISFELSGREYGTLSLGNIVHNSIVTENEYKIDINDFNRHCFVSGLTGSGKTNTIKSMLNAVRETSPEIKFLIIEPAKTEYWQLYNAGFHNLRIFTVGSNEGLTYRVNLFERVENIPIQTHIDYVLAVFKASFIMYTPMPYVLERAIYSIYEDIGWDITNDINRFGEKFPTLDNLYYKIPFIVDEMGYEDKMQRDLIGSLQARINSMRIGTKGKTLNVTKTVPFQEILSQDTIIELENIADDEVKAFIISSILIQLMEYRLQKVDCQKEIKHLLLFEEAHRLLKNVQSGTGESADPRGNAVDFFCNMLAELRSKGQGFIIADQIPSKLASDVIKNTNIKITHRIVDGEERRLIGNSMHMTDEQIEYLSSLRQGYSAIYAEGDDRPKLVKARYAEEYTTKTSTILKRKEILEIMKHQQQNNCYTERIGITEVCARCNELDCDGKKSSKLFCDGELNQLINKVAEECKNRDFNNEYMEKLIQELKNNYFEGINNLAVINCFINELLKKMDIGIVDNSKFVCSYYKFISEFLDQ